MEKTTSYVEKTTSDIIQITSHLFPTVACVCKPKSYTANAISNQIAVIQVVVRFIHKSLFPRTVSFTSLLLFATSSQKVFF